MSSNLRNVKLKMFDTVFNDLLNDLKCLRPNDSSLSLLNSLVSVISTEILVQQFMECVEEYKDEIFSKDEDFFINELPNLIGHSFAATELKRIASIWTSDSTSDEDKEIMWKYMITLTKLGMSLKQ